MNKKKEKREREEKKRWRQKIKDNWREREMSKRKVGKEKGKSVCRWIPCFMHNIYIYITYISN